MASYKRARRHRRRARQPRRRGLAELTSQARAAGPRGAACAWSRPSARAPSSRSTSCTELSRERGEVQRLIDQLVSARLLVVQTGEGGAGATVEIVHESLIHSWPTLRRWLEESQEDSQFLEQLRNAAKQWQNKERDPGFCGAARWSRRRGASRRRYRGELGAAAARLFEGGLRPRRPRGATARRLPPSAAACSSPACSWPR